ncbi:hypothetical protein WBJ53_08730 [Spirosoma sp. SC4-14]|uniref:hypothetical protein n=1 Tax=Spirosoma sp. SC4-14 TaxID=3128900 RepID=UPI0030CC0673
MSVSSKSRKESTESFAAQQMHNTMGIAPELAQLNDKNLDNDLPSRVADSNDTDVPGDVDVAEALATENGDQPTAADVEEAKRASWGQPPLPAEADWNQRTNEGAVPITRTDEPDQTLGNS